MAGVQGLIKLSYYPLTKALPQWYQPGSDAACISYNNTITFSPRVNDCKIR